MKTLCRHAAVALCIVVVRSTSIRELAGIASAWFHCYTFDSNSPLDPALYPYAMTECMLQCAQLDGCRKLWFNTTCHMSPPSAVPGTRCELKPYYQTNPGGTIAPIVASKMVATLARGQAYRYFGLVDDGSVRVFARNGVFPDGGGNLEHIVYFERSGPDLEGLQETSRLWMELGPAHNFGLHLHGEGFHVCGGRSHDFESGVVCYKANDVDEGLSGNFVKQSNVLLHVAHPGCRENVFVQCIGNETTRGACHEYGGCEYDGKVSVAKLRGQYFLYVRMNTGKGRRFIQVAHARSLYEPFSPLQPIKVKGWDECDVMRASVYFPSIHENPALENTLLGFFPVNWDWGEEPTDFYDRECYLALSISCDGIHFSPFHKVLKNTCAQYGRVLDLPVDGIVRRGDMVHLYVHRYMPMAGYALESDFSPQLVRHTMTMDSLRDYSLRAMAQLAGKDDDPDYKKYTQCSTPPPRQYSSWPRRTFIKGMSPERTLFGAGCVHSQRPGGRKKKPTVPAPRPLRNNTEMRR